MSMKDAYVAKLEAQLKEWGAELSSLKAKAGNAVAQGRVDFEERLKATQATHDSATQKLDELKKAGDAQWEALKAGVEGAWKQLRSSLDSAKK